MSEPSGKRQGDASRRSRGAGDGEPPETKQAAKASASRARATPAPAPKAAASKKAQPRAAATRSKAAGAAAKATPAKKAPGAATPKQPPAKATTAKQPTAKGAAPGASKVARNTAGKGGTTRPTTKKTGAARAAATGADAAGSAAKPPATAAKKPPASAAAKPAQSAAQANQQAINRELWTRYAETRDPALRERLILQYAPLVKYVMGRLAISLPAILDYEDILSYGTIGLIEAVERFDQDKGVKFETYAISRVRGSIIDALRSLDRLPRSVRQKAKDADAAITKLTVDLGREPTDAEVAASLGVALKDHLQHIVDASWITISLDSVGLSDADDDAPGEMAVADPDAEEIGADLERDELIGELAEAIRELLEREQLVLSLYYKDELTMREVSKVLGISESRVCQLHARALSRLRSGMARIQQGEAA